MTTRQPDSTASLSTLVHRYFDTLTGIEAMGPMPDEQLNAVMDAGPNALIRCMAEAEIRTASDARAALRWIEHAGVPIKPESEADGMIETMAALLAVRLDLWLDKVSGAFEGIGAAVATAERQPREEHPLPMADLGRLVDDASTLTDAQGALYLAAGGITDSTERQRLGWLAGEVLDLAEGLSNSLEALHDDCRGTDAMEAAERVLEEA